MSTVAVSPLRRLGFVVGGIVVVWIALLLVLGSIFGARKAQAIADRLGETLQATATLDDHDLALVRGRLRLDHLRVARNDLTGKLTLDVGKVRCELAPLGIALFDGSCRELAISDLRLELSTFALFKLKKPTRPPIRAHAVTIENATMIFSPAAVEPSLGRITLTIDRATAGATTMKTPLSWIFHLRTLNATLELPVGKIKIDYANGMLTAAGGLFGVTPVTLPFQIPVANLADDPKAELQRLAKIGKQLAEDLVEQKARDWLRSKR
ncbi:MAG: hypothetical protein H0V17_19600 [Deltaproteobacteria bacterium]|nr:hypothetical protein [Deltaproteobacteria bacterium]